MNLDGYMPEIYREDYQASSEHKVNNLAFSLSIVQNDNKDNIFKQIVNKRPHELMLLKDAMQQMKDQLNNKLPS